MGNEPKVLTKDYVSPRWSMEILDCSMPMSFDTYSRCSYGCLYCFSFFQKSHSVNGYLEGRVRSVNPEKVINLFENIRAGRFGKLHKTESQFVPYVLDGRIMQWGGLADEFDEYERRYGLTLELLKYFDSIDYPLSFSTKGTWWTQDARYMDLFKRHTHNWHVKVSIITNDDSLAKRMERGVDSSTGRLAAIKALASQGQHVTLRLRPYIIGLSEDYGALIPRAKAAGADSVTTEFFCLECRADANLKKRYAEMSKIVGYDIFDFYMKQSEQQGYKRLNKGIKAPIIAKMRDLTHSLGLRFHVSDAYCRECNDSCNCCGVPPEWNVSQRGQIGQAIIIAREKGYVRWSDIAPYVNKYFSGFEWNSAASYNTGSNKKRALMYDTTMAQFVHGNWNNIHSGNSPARGYGGVLTPDGVDENGDVIYKYTPKQ